MTRPDGPRVLVTATALGLLAVVAAVVAALPYTDVLYQQDGSEAEAVAAITEWPPSLVADLVLRALGFPLATLAHAATGTSGLTVVAYLVNVVGVAAAWTWAADALRARRRGPDADDAPRPPDSEGP